MGEREESGVGRWDRSAGAGRRVRLSPLIPSGLVGSGPLLSAHQFRSAVSGDSSRATNNLVYVVFHSIELNSIQSNQTKFTHKGT